METCGTAEKAPCPSCEAIAWQVLDRYTRRPRDLVSVNQYYGNRVSIEGGQCRLGVDIYSLKADIQFVEYGSSFFTEVAVLAQEQLHRHRGVSVRLAGWAWRLRRRRSARLVVGLRGAVVP